MLQRAGLYMVPPVCQLVYGYLTDRVVRLPDQPIADEYATTGAFVQSEEAVCER